MWKLSYIQLYTFACLGYAHVCEGFLVVKAVSSYRVVVGESRVGIIPVDTLVQAVS